MDILLIDRKISNNMRKQQEIWKNNIFPTPFLTFITLAHFYRPVAWKAGSWTLAVYSHYNRGHFYNDRPKVFVTYKGGNNHKHDRFYADRHVAMNTNRGNGGHFGRK